MAKKSHILIVTDKFDPHADVVIVELRRRGHQPVRFHPADFPTRLLTTLTFDHHQWNGSVSLPKGDIFLSDIQSIWWRKPEPSVILETLPPDQRELARQETRATLTGLWNCIDCYWMSFPLNIQRASNKIEQLQRAARLGFRVPRTLVTNDPSQARQFYHACHGQIIYKTLYSPMLGVISEGGQNMGTRMVFTTLVTPELLHVIDTVHAAPCLFQEYIPKRLELRITIIGDELFPCEIHSQQHDRTRIDWRHYDVDVPYKKGKLPHDIREKCFAFTRSYGLHYSAMDLILTPEGEYVFLENNPNGQCFFIQQQIPELKMAETIADYLIQGKAENA